MFRRSIEIFYVKENIRRKLHQICHIDSVYQSQFDAAIELKRVNSFILLKTYLFSTLYSCVGLCHICKLFSLTDMWMLDGEMNVEHFLGKFAFSVYFIMKILGSGNYYYMLN